MIVKDGIAVFSVSLDPDVAAFDLARGLAFIVGSGESFNVAVWVDPHRTQRWALVTWGPYRAVPLHRLPGGEELMQRARTVLYREQALVPHAEHSQ